MDNEQVFGALREEFDMPFWAFSKVTGAPLKELTKTFIYQLKNCNIHCLWCYVDDKSKNGQEANGAKFFSMEEIMDVFEQERGKQKLHNFRPSGGEPTLAVEQWLEALNQISDRKMSDVFVQGDTNLTTGHFMEYLEENGEIQPNTLKGVGEYKNFGLLCSFKGTDTESFMESVGMPKGFEFLEEERWHTFGKIVRAGIDAYPFIYSPNPKTLEKFMEKGAGLFGDGFYLKSWIVPLKLYGPEKERLAKIGRNSEEYQKQLDDNFNASKEVMQNLVWDKLGVNYQAVPRTGIELRVRK